MCLLIGLGVWVRDTLRRVSFPRRRESMVLILLCFFASGTVSLNQSALCVWWGKTGAIAACKAGVYFLGCWLSQGVRWCCNPSYIKLRCLWVVVRGPKRCWAAASCLGGEVGDVDDTMTHLLGGLLCKNSRLSRFFDLSDSRLSRLGRQLSYNLSYAKPQHAGVTK